MLRKITAGFVATLAATGALVAASGAAVAVPMPETVSQSTVSAQGTWVYVRFFEVDPRLPNGAKVACTLNAQQNYPGRNYECRTGNGVIELWVEY